jgi:hypothetical protein
MEEMRNAHKILVGRHVYTWDDIRIVIRKVEWESVEWIQMARDRDQWRAVVYTVMNFRVP